MSPTKQALHPNSFYYALPKIDLHRHLEGSLRLATLIEVGRAHGLSLPNTTRLHTNRLRELVQISDEEPFTFENFLKKFEPLRMFYRSPEVISRITVEAIADAAADQVRYLELRFTPAALSRIQGFPLGEVMDWVIAGAQQAEEQYGVRTRLIASMNRHEDPVLAEEVVAEAVQRMDKGIVGVDLAGNESHFPGIIFAGVFKEANENGLHITIHAGEWGGAQNVVEAITHLRAERIGHGVRVLEDPAATALARERGVSFEVCITSNYQSGVVPALTVHPLPRMINLGLNVTLNTDDPSISQITLGHEYQVAAEELGIPLAELRARTLAAAQASFLPEADKVQLIQQVEREFPA